MARTKKGGAAKSTSEFVDSATGAKIPADPALWRSDGGGTYLPVLPKFRKGDIDRESRSVWRYRAMLPLDADTPKVTLGEGGTPLVEASIVGMPVVVKLEYLQPTGSFKDRGSAVLATALAAAGVRSAVEDSSGNAGSSLAAYLSHLNIGLRLFVPSSTPAARLRQAAAHGAEIDNSARTRAEAAAKAQGALGDSVVYASHVYSPYFLAGQTTMAYEIWEDLGCEVPDNIVVPIGHGTLLLGLYLGFKQLKRARLVKSLPRIFGVQARTCAPVYDAYTRGADATVPVAARKTIAIGIQVEDPPRGPEVLRAIADTGGAVLNVSDSEIRRGQALAANLGWYVEAASASAIAGVVKLDKLIGEGETMVVPLTGSGLKQ
ncbi:MAG: pyridoxal-phosphate dependent enzyme [Anaerolineae bacterium]